ncbi:Hsp20/alpha crystallin family protein [soil metagenome]
MAMVRYNPTRDATSWSGMGQLQDQINRLFNMLGDDSELESSGATADWIPPVDINEYRDRFQLFVDLPGLDADKVDVTLDNSVLTISGERHGPEVEDKEDRAAQRRIERGHGRFYRRFILPDTVDSERVKAVGRNGVLEITIPKQAKAQPRRIKVAA